MDCVVYKLVNTWNGKRYIGSTEAYIKRQKQHLKHLSLGTHKLISLQNDWNDQKGEGFKFRVLKRFRSRSRAYDYEVQLINAARPNRIYNILRGGQGGDAITFNPKRNEIRQKHYLNGKALSKTEINRRFSRPGDLNGRWKGGISIKICDCGKQMGRKAITCGECRDRSGKNNPFYGRKHSRKTRKMLSDINKGHIPSNARSCKINGHKYVSMNEASRVLDIPVPTILYRIRSNSEQFRRYKSC